LLWTMVLAAKSSHTIGPLTVSGWQSWRTTQRSIVSSRRSGRYTSTPEPTLGRGRSMDRKVLIEAAIAQIMRDVDAGDFTAIWELMERVDQEALASFLPEERLAEIRG